MVERELSKSRALIPLTRRVTDAAIELSRPLDDEPEFMHAVLCQVGLPRSEVKSREFTRSTGGASMLIEAGKWFDGMRYHDMPLPYGTRPRLVLFHVCSEAVRRKSPEVEVERSASAFLERLGIKKSGESFAAFKKQMLALAACRMQIGYQTDTKVVNVKCDPIQRFDAWTQCDNGQLGLWPGVIQLSGEFYETLREHAVPLDPRAIAALQNSALALDTYTWLAHRLCRIRQNRGVTLYWKNLKDQFGQEYRSDKDFKREFAGALRKAQAVYPEARIEIVRGGVQLFASPPPIKRRQVTVALPAPATAHHARPVSAPNDGDAGSDTPAASSPMPPFVARLTPATIRTATALARGMDIIAIYQAYGRMLDTLGGPLKRDLQEAFLSYVRGYCASRGTAATAKALDASKIQLSVETLNTAASKYPGWDIEELRQRWLEWIGKSGNRPDHPDRAFLGFVRTHTKSAR
jgi:hypothetical protein